MGIALAPDYESSRELFLCYAYDAPAGPQRAGRAVSRRRRRTLGEEGADRGNPGRAVSRRLPPPIRARPEALRHDRRRHRRKDRPGPRLARRQDAAPECRRKHSRGQPVSGLARSSRTATATRRASTGIPGRVFRSRPSMAPRDSTGRAAATRSTSSRPERTTAGRSSTTGSRARAWSRRSWSTRPAVAPSGASFSPRRPAARLPRATSSSRRSAASGSSACDSIRRTRAGSRETEELFRDVYGRLRDVVSGPDGALYVATSNRDGRGHPHPGDDRILRIVEVPPRISRVH